MIKENEPFLFLVTHIETEAEYLKLWAQTDEMVIQSVSKMLTSLQDKFDYSQNNIASPNNVMPHTHCCARGPNNEFARAKILGFRSDGMVLVQYVDYGNVIHVPIHNIRLLDNLPGAEYLFSVPYAATCFLLADIMPIGGSWLPEVIKQIRSFLVNNSFQGVYRQINGCKVIKFSMMNQDFGTLLVNKNMALFSSSRVNSTQPTPATHVQSLRMPHQARNSAQENWRAPVAQQAPPQKAGKTNSFKAIQLEIGSVHDVQVSYVDEGPCKFSIQLLESIPYLEAMMKSINSRPHIALQESPIAGTVCLGQQTHPQRLCRVVLNSPGDTSCKVYYADFGHHEVLPFSSLYQIPDEFVVPNIFSIRFTMNGISGWTVTQEMKDYFGGVVANKSLKLRVCKGPLSPLTQYGDLFLNGKSIRDILSEVFPESCELFYSEPKQLQIGAKETVMVPFVESTAKFFVQIESDEKFLDDLMQQVEQASKTAPKLTQGQIRKDMPCMALYDDQKWYRASILKVVDDTKISVFYVDYGNEEMVLLHNLRAIPSHLILSLPRQAIKCSLNQYQFESSNPETNKKFENLVFEERMIVEPIDYVNGSYIVDLHDAKYISDPMGDIAKKLRAMETSHNHANAKNQESFEKYPPQQQRSEEKSQLVQKPRVRNKNVKSRENWTGAGNWNKDREPGMIQKTNSFETSDNSKSKFRKDNENEQRHDNRFQSGPQGGRATKDERRNDRFDQDERYRKQPESSSRFSAPKDYPANDRFNRSNERNNLDSPRLGKESQNNRSGANPRMDRSYGSDRDSDTSSKSGGRRNNQRVRESPPNRNRTGRWENDQHGNDAPRNGLSNYNSGDMSKARSPRDNPQKINQNRPDMSYATRSSESKAVPKATTSEIPPPNITGGAVKNCMVVFYKSPTSFYVQLCPDNEELDLVMDKISDAYEEGGRIVAPSHIKEGLHCIAQWQEDKKWYRAVVKGVNGSAVTVLFIDYGNLETVGSDKIKEIQPELCKLPAQAIHCELFCPPKSNWTKEESDQLANATDDKPLEAEFITAEQGLYKILLRDVKSAKYLNDMFAKGVDLLKEKEAIRNQVKSLARGGGGGTAPDYAPLSEKWLENRVDFGKKYNATLEYFVNPESFYLQLQNQLREFKEMMKEIQVTYNKRSPVSEPLKVGSSVIAILAEDRVLYRAEVIELDKPRGPVVLYVDYGDRAMVDLRHIYPVEKKYMVLPKQAVHCGLKNVAPVSGSSWSNAAEKKEHFNGDRLEAIFHESQDGHYLISLKADGNDVAKSLVQNNLAIFSSIDKSEALKELAGNTVQTEEVPKIDINLLEGQTLQVNVSSVEGVDKFHVQFYSAKACQQTVNSYMASKDPQVMPGLLPHEVCLGAGCLINSKKKWRRGVVVDMTKSYYDVRLIDTGEHEKVTLNRMLKLPGQLSTMQNQAVECSLLDVPPSPKANEMLKSSISGKSVKIFVERVERNRLIVRLFDLNGNKIKVPGSQDAEKISPICNLPILSSTHEVIVTNLKNSACLWLQRTSDAPLEKQLLDDMYEHYSKVKVQAMAIEKEVFAARWTDGYWYRVFVLELEGLDKVKVQLLDYGDVGHILVSDLRTLDPRFYAPHQLAIRVSLTVSLSGDNVSQIELLQPMVKDKQLAATFYNVNRRWIAELSDAGEKLSDKLRALGAVEDASPVAAIAAASTHFEQPDLGDMLVGERYDVQASHVDTPNLLWLQRREEEEALFDLHDQMQQVAASCPDYEGVPEEKSLCLAVYSLDGCWYRAEVIDADADITTVRFIDYGNTDVVDSSVGRIKQLPDKWRAVKKFAVACKLDVVPANGDDWTEEACARIKQLTATDAPLRALVIADKAPMRVDLFLEDDRSACELLVAEGLAAYVKGADELDEQDPLEAVEEEQFDPRSAFASHVISVDEFWVQEDAKVKDLEMVADRLVMASMFPLLPKVERGLVCIAHYPEDNQHYRALVLSHDDKGARVNYIDYGNSATTEEMRSIPQDLADIPPLSKKCCLAKPDGVERWPDNADAEFDKLAANGATVFILDAIAQDGDTCLVRMTHDSKDVAMELLELCAQSAAPQAIVVHESKDIAKTERPAPLGEETTASGLCKISCAISPSEFWMQKKSDYLEVENVLKRLADSEILASAEDVEEGKILAARRSDEDPQCYRCKVLAKSDAGIQVLFIDFGTRATVHSDALFRELPEDLAHIPALAVASILAMPEGSKLWPDSACARFAKLTADGSAEFRFEVLDDAHSEGPLPVALYYEDQHVAELLLSSSDKPTTGESSKHEDPSGQDVSNDSAVHSETEQHSSKDTTMLLVVEDEEKIDDLDKHIEKICQEVQMVVEPKSAADQEEKIVPGSISRGLSVEEIARYSPVPAYCRPEEKIVPGSINKGNAFAAESVSSQEDESLDTLVAKAPEGKDCESEEVSQVTSELQAISFDDRVVPSCISRGETPVEMDRPSTPKTAHSEKLVAGAVNAQSTLDFEDAEETLSVEVKENIPEAAL